MMAYYVIILGIYPPIEGDLLISFKLLIFPHHLKWPSTQWEFQDPTDGGTLVPYVWPYFVGIFPQK